MPLRRRAPLKLESPLITLPLVILHGTEDRAAKPSGSRLFHRLAGSTDKTLKLYEGHFHDLLRDSVCNPEKAVTWREIYLSVDDPDKRQPSCGLHAGDYKEDLRLRRPAPALQ